MVNLSKHKIDIRPNNKFKLITPNSRVLAINVSWKGSGTVRRYNFRGNLCWTQIKTTRCLELSRLPDIKALSWQPQASRAMSVYCSGGKLSYLIKKNVNIHKSHSKNILLGKKIKSTWIPKFRMWYENSAFCPENSRKFGRRVRWVVRSIPHGGPVDLHLVSASRLRLSI